MDYINYDQLARKGKAMTEQEPMSTEQKLYRAAIREEAMSRYLDVVGEWLAYADTLPSDQTTECIS